MKNLLKMSVQLGIIALFFAVLTTGVSFVVAEAKSIPGVVTRSDDVDFNEKRAQWEISELVEFVSQDLDTFWQQTFEQIEREYFSPTEVSGYTTAIRTACGTARPNNAFYCGRSHSIHYDSNFLNRVLNRVGDFAAATVIAHEWGHVIQAHLGLLGNLTIQSELQADCLAGVYAKHALENDLFGMMDIEEGSMFLSLIGDPEDTPWFAAGAHGSSSQRENAFEKGLEFGIERCFGVF